MLQSLMPSWLGKCRIFGAAAAKNEFWSWPLNILTSENLPLMLLLLPHHLFSNLQGSTVPTCFNKLDLFDPQCWAASNAFCPWNLDPHNWNWRSATSKVSTRLFWSTLVFLKQKLQIPNTSKKKVYTSVSGVCSRRVCVKEPSSRTKVSLPTPNLGGYRMESHWVRYQKK